MWVISSIFFLLSQNKSSEKLSLSTLSKANLRNPSYFLFPLFVYLQTRLLFDLLFIIFNWYSFITVYDL